MNGKIVDDAKGYGYKSYQTASKMLWYKFKGGKEKIAATTRTAKAYWKGKEVISAYIIGTFESYIKEVALGDVTTADIIADAEKEFNTPLDRQMVNWLIKYGDRRNCMTKQKIPYSLKVKV